MAGYIDRIKPLATIAVTDAQTDGQRSTSDVDNNKRIERLLLRITGNLAVTQKGAGLNNRGSVLGGLGDIGFTDGGADVYALDARLARFIAECMSPSTLPAIRAADATVGQTALVETVPLWLASPRSVNPNQTKYKEVNPGAKLQAFISPKRGANVQGIVAGAVATLTGVQATVEMVYDDLIGSPPYFTTIVRQVVQNVPGANALFKIDLRGNRYIRGIAIQQDSDGGEVSDIIASIAMRGDNRSVWGDAQIPYIDLVEHSAEEFGGDVCAAPGYLFMDFQRYGRMTSWWHPNGDTNPRLEMTVQAGAGVNPRIRVGIIEYQRTPACGANPFKM